MSDFLFVFRADTNAVPKGSPEEMQAITKQWMDWIGSIAAQKKLANRGNRLYPSGKVLRGNNIITDGPYTGVGGTLVSYAIIKADSLEEAVGLAKGCPGLLFGGSVEVREINAM